VIRDSQMVAVARSWHYIWFYQN